ncbi:hypothetical protein DAEQUDRAFT_756973 [Daedalea quercina L-15889]|uniref:Uncharacterized protein n=1 Tax=Daedalea quercina L-15889 TaxID=1314783 RepID=A0A165QF40_9APHY|nr:hypothetical protein DAEQUDRAFT_756973 [Daedalea quercina L-15889]
MTIVTGPANSQTLVLVNSRAAGLIGNIRHLPSIEQHKTFAKWGAQYTTCDHSQLGSGCVRPHGDTGCKILEQATDYLLVRAERFLGIDMGERELGDPKKLISGFGRRIFPGEYLADDNVWLFTAQMVAMMDIRATKMAPTSCHPLFSFLDVSYTMPRTTSRATQYLPLAIHSRLSATSNRV